MATVIYTSAYICSCNGMEEIMTDQTFPLAGFNLSFQGIMAPDVTGWE